MRSGELTIKLPGVDELTTLIQSVHNAVNRMELLATLKPTVVETSSDSWLDAEQARAYLGNMSKGTFDKYRYQTKPCIKGYKLDGKILYKKSDLDAFVHLYEIKSSGLA